MASTPRLLTRPHLLRQTLTPHLQLPARIHPRTQNRTFLPDPTTLFNTLTSSTTNGTNSPQILTETRILPYPSAPIYSIIADVSSYSTFLPYCQSSLVTRWSAPDAVYNRRWPSEGLLTIGFSGLEESFRSRVFCVPGKVVESVGGVTKTSLPEGEIGHHLGEENGANTQNPGDGDAGSSLLTHLRSKWTLETESPTSTRITLALEFSFANPLYTALSAGAAPKVADKMIRAFEERVKVVLDGNLEVQRAGLAELEGSKLIAKK